MIIAREELANAPGWVEKGRARGWVWLERAP